MNKEDFVYSNSRIGLKPLTRMELTSNYPNWFYDEEVNKFNSHFSRPNTPSQVEGFVESLSSDSTKIVMAIYWLENNTHIGNVSLQQIDHKNQCAELAFLLGEKQYWGKGVGKEAADFLVNHGIKHLNIRRFSLGCLSDNVGMNKLALKLGFQQEGSLKQALFNNGVFKDVNLYGRLV